MERTEWPRVLISKPVVLFDKLGSAREGFSHYFGEGCGEMSPLVIRKVVSRVKVSSNLQPVRS